MASSRRRALRCIAVAVAGVAFSPRAGAAETLGVLAGPTSSAYYPLAVALGKAIGKALPHVKAPVQATKGSFENLLLLQAGRGEIGFALGDALSEAWKGSEEAGFTAPLAKLRGIAALYPNYVQIVARADSGVRSLTDLKGKRISVGTPKSGTAVNARAIFAAAGIAWKSFRKVEYLPFGESVELMKDRQLDATLQSAAAGALSLRDLANAVDMIVVPVPAAVTAKIADAAYMAATISAHTYRGQNNDVPAVVVQNCLVTHTGVSEEIVHAVTKALWTDAGDVAAAHPAAKAIDVHHALAGMPVPLHAGAETYYREIGVLK